MDRHAITVAAVLGPNDQEEAEDIAAELVQGALTLGVPPDAWVSAWVVLYTAGVDISTGALLACLAFSRTFGASVPAVATALTDALVADFDGARELGLDFALEGHRIRCSLGAVSVLVDRSPTGIVSAFVTLAGYFGRLEASA